MGIVLSRVLFWMKNVIVVLPNSWQVGIGNAANNAYNNNAVARYALLPAMALTLLLKKLGLGEHIIVASDVPDIVLAKIDLQSPVEAKRRLEAFPLEAMFINQYAIQGADGISDLEKVSNLIISKKFSKRYVPETMLLVTLGVELINIDFKALANILAGAMNPFHQVWIFADIGSDNCILARLTPGFELYKLNITKDLTPLIY